MHRMLVGTILQMQEVSTLPTMEAIIQVLGDIILQLLEVEEVVEATILQVLEDISLQLLMAIIIQALAAIVTLLALAVEFLEVIILPMRVDKHL